MVTSPKRPLANISKIDRTTGACSCVDDERGRCGRGLLHIVVSVDAVAVAAQLSHAQPVEPPARGALDDLGPLQFRDRPEHGDRELVFGIVDVVLALDDDSLAVLDELAEDDRLIRDITGDAIRIEEIHRVEQIGLYVPPQLFERRPIQQRAAVSVVDVLLDEHIARGGDLPLELEHLALDRPFFLLRIGAHACVQNRSFHTTPLIPEPRQGVESEAGDKRARASIVEGQRRLGNRGQEFDGAIAPI